MSVDGGLCVARVTREDSESVPMWYFGIIAFALSLSGITVSGGFIRYRFGGVYGFPGIRLWHPIRQQR